MGARNRQTAQKRRADLARRHTRPPEAGARPAEPGQDENQQPQPARPPAPRQAVPQPPAAPAPAGGNGRREKKVTTPRITPQVVAEGLYELVKAPDHAETRAWHVLAGGRKAGLVRPTWRGERARPGWEGIDVAGVAVPAIGTGRSPPQATPGLATPPPSASSPCCGGRAIARAPRAERRPPPVDIPQPGLVPGPVHAGVHAHGFQPAATSMATMINYVGLDLREQTTTPLVSHGRYFAAQARLGESDLGNPNLPMSHQPSR